MEEYPEFPFPCPPPSPSPSHITYYNRLSRRFHWQYLVKHTVSSLFHSRFTRCDYLIQQVFPHDATFVTTASEIVQIGLVGLLTRPVIKAIFPSERNVTTLGSSSSSLFNGLNQYSSSTPAGRTIPVLSPQSNNKAAPPQQDNLSPLTSNSPDELSDMATAAPRAIVANPQGDLSLAQSEQAMQQKAENLSLADGQVDNNQGMTNIDPYANIQRGQEEGDDVETYASGNGMENLMPNENGMNASDNRIGNNINDQQLRSNTRESFGSEYSDRPNVENPNIVPSNLVGSGRQQLAAEPRLGPNNDSKMELGSALASDPRDMKQQEPNGDAMSTRTGRTAATARTGVTNRTAGNRPT